MAPELYDSHFYLLVMFATTASIARYEEHDS